MSMSDQEWRGIKKDVNRGGLFGIGWVLTIIVICALVGMLGWGFTVLTSGIKGKGDATIQKNSGTNQIVQDARFQQLNESYKGSLAKIKLAQADVKASPTDKIATTNLMGAQQYCVDLVNQYNALAQSFVSEDFRGTNLPSSLDQLTCTEGN